MHVIKVGFFILQDLMSEVESSEISNQKMEQLIPKADVSFETVLENVQ